MIDLTAEQEQAVKDWATDDRLWTTQETVEFNLRTFARLILKLQLEEVMPDKGKGRIESPMTPVKTISSYTSSPGSYNEHPNLGPKGVDGGLPLKFTDDSIKGIMPEGPSMEPTPAKVTKG